MPNFENVQKELISLQNKILNDEELIDRIAYFYFRWQDEMKYEDFNDYKTAVKKCFKKRLNLEAKLLKPFTVKINEIITGHKCLIELRFGKTKVTSRWKILN